MKYAVEMTKVNEIFEERMNTLRHGVRINQNKCLIATGQQSFGEAAEALDACRLYQVELDSLLIVYNSLYAEAKEVDKL